MGARQDGESSPCPSPSNGLDIRSLFERPPCIGLSHQELRSSSGAWLALQHPSVLVHRPFACSLTLAPSLPPLRYGLHRRTTRLQRPHLQVGPHLLATPRPRTDGPRSSLAFPAASTKGAPGELEPELESVPLPPSVDPSERFHLDLAYFVHC